MHGVQRALATGGGARHARHTAAEPGEELTEAEPAQLEWLVCRREGGQLLYVGIITHGDGQEVQVATGAEICHALASAAELLR